MTIKIGASKHAFLVRSYNNALRDRMLVVCFFNNQNIDPEQDWGTCVFLRVSFTCLPRLVSILKNKTKIKGFQSLEGND